VKYLGRGEDKLPMILSGDFDVKFVSKDSEPSTTFLNEDLNLLMNSNPIIPTKMSGTSINAVFTQFLDFVLSQTYISLLTYHKPIISVVPI